MKTLQDTRVIVQVGQCECHAVTTTQVHHHDFPELHAEGITAAEAGAHLKNLLLRTLDSVPSGPRREEFEQALLDVTTFINSHR